jgi:hypothetical protein
VDTRTYAWLYPNSPTTPFLPSSGATYQQGRHVQTDVSGDTWFFAAEFFIPSGFQNIQHMMRFWNLHVPPGYPGWMSSYATSAMALDVYPPGTDLGTDGINGKTSHSTPFFQMQLNGGGTWDATLDGGWWRNVTKRYFQWNIAYNTWYKFKGSAKFMSNGTGFFVASMNGVPWINYQNARLNYPGLNGHPVSQGKAAFTLWEGAYEAASSFAAQREQVIRHSPSRWGRTESQMLNDIVTITIGDHSVGVNGAPNSRNTNTNTTVDDGAGVGSGTAPLVQIAPQLTGEPKPGGTLLVGNGTWTGSPTPTFTRRWEKSADQVNWTTTGSNAATYNPLPSDVGFRIRAVIRGANTLGSAESPTASVLVQPSSATITSFGLETLTPNATYRPLTGDIIRGNEFYLPVEATLGTIKMRLQGNTNPGSQNIVAGVYTSVDGVPTTRHAITAAVNVASGAAPAVRSFVPTTNPVLQPGVYLLAVHSDLVVGGTSLVAEALFDGAPGSLIFKSDDYTDGLPSPWGTLSSSSPGDGLLNIWAEVTPTTVDPPTSYTRFYMPSTGAADVTPVAYAGWGITAFADNLEMVTTKIGSASASGTNPGGASAASGLKVLRRRYVSNPLPAQTIGADVFVKAMLRVRESNAAMNVYSQCRLWVCSNDGTVNRGTLIDFSTTFPGMEWDIGLVNKKFPSGWTGDGVACNPVTLSANDRLVWEPGAQFTSAYGSAWTTEFRFGDVSASDLAENETAFDDFNPWIEFSRDLFDVVPTVDPPTFTTSPTISGTAKVGSTLTASPGTVTGDPLIEYQWKVDDGGGYDPIAGATNQAYTADPATLGFPLKVTVTLTNAGGTVSQDSAATAAVATGGPVTLTPPVVVGLALLGAQVLGVVGTYENAPTSYEFQWQRDTAGDEVGVDITGATSPEYVTRDDDLTDQLRVKVRAINAVDDVEDYSDWFGPILWPGDSGTLVVAGEEELVGDGIQIWEATSNLVLNGGFESDLTGWTDGVGDNMIERTTTRFYHGGSSARLERDPDEADTNVGSYPITLTAEQHTASAYVFVPAGFAGTVVQMAVEGFAGATGTLTANANVATRNEWQRLSCTFTPDAGDLSGSIVFRVTSAAKTEAFLDGVQVEVQPLPTPYVDTDPVASSETSRAATRVRAQAGLLDETTGTLIVRLRSGFSNAAETGQGTPTVFSWRDSATERLYGYYDEASNAFVFDRDTGAGGASVSVAHALTVGADVTAAFVWTATHVKLSLNGAAATSVANTAIPTLSAAVFDFGSVGGVDDWLDGTVFWAAAFPSALSDADLLAIHSLLAGGDSPEADDLPATAVASAVFPFDYGGTVPPFGRFRVTGTLTELKTWIGRFEETYTFPHDAVSQDEQWLLEYFAGSYPIVRDDD